MTYLDDRRKEIDEIDKALTNLFEKRMVIVREIAKYKLENNLPIQNISREEEVIMRNGTFLENKDLEPFLKEFFTRLMELSKDYQRTGGGL